VKRTFKEKAVYKAAGITNKYKVLTPVAFLILGVVLGFYNLLKHFYANGKKYVTIGMVLLFFLMSSSFTSPEVNEDSEVYLFNNGSLNIYDDNVSLVQSDIDEFGNPVIVSDVATFMNSEVLSIEEDTDLSDIENIESFTLDDFYAGLCLHENVDNTVSAFDKDSWNLLLVNKTNPLPDGYEVPLATIKGTMKCDERVLDPLHEMLNAADKDGVNLIVCSPYREDQLQERLFLRKINAYMSYGYSYLEAYKISSQDVIVPGTSEHQLGLAFDIVVDYHMVLDSSFGDTIGGKWLKNHCAEYGFILRYPKGKETVTGIEYEPWHFRYVGVDAAEYIMKNELTLEEFIEQLQ